MGTTSGEEKKVLTSGEKEFIKAFKKGWVDDLPFFILSEKVDPNCIFKAGNNFLTKIFSNSHAGSLAEFLKKHGLNLNLTDSDGVSLLEISVCQRDHSFCEALLSLGASPNIQTSEKKSILLLAIEYTVVTKRFYGIEFVEDLLRAGAKCKKDFPELSEEDFPKSPSVLAKILCHLFIEAQNKK